MEEQKFSFSESFQKTKEYVETQIDLLKLRSIAKSSRMAGAMALDLTKLVLSLIIVFFLSLALGFFLGELTGSNSLGFLITAIIFVIILLIVRAKEPQLEAKLMDLVISRVLSKWNGEEDLNYDEKGKEAYSANQKNSGETQQTTGFNDKDVNQDEVKN